VQLSIRSLYHEPLGFLGRSDGLGDINVLLKTTNVHGGIEVATVLVPCPYNLEPGQCYSLAYEYVPPEDPGHYMVHMIVQQRCPEPTTLARSEALMISVAKSPEQIVQDAFGCGAKGPDDWFRSPWFGHLYVGDYPWVYSEQHGWVRVFVPAGDKFDVTQADIRFWDSEVGNWITNMECYPTIRLLDGEAMEFVSSDESKRRFLPCTGGEKLYGRGTKT
jgi:hypothetical protein